ncbi:MAG: universal stress protein UspA [Caldibacillus debilis]|uniref:Universal stress protein n=1 Tax=Caldibacillus debilis TaxID=301148 RepID=A0A3E0K887_9BACI|nr:universal stress protein [Caldibacillus debilis]REJ31434.1 MAG: universal stress protein UspA [Caldibacillus debilis]
MNYKNIIVAIDGSKEAERAFKKALKIAKQSGGKLFLTHIIDIHSLARLEAFDQSLSECVDQMAQEMMLSYKEQAVNEGIDDVKIVIDYGSPKVKIAKDIAKKFDADLIVCGATGLNAVERFIIGSVSEAIVRHARCDVLVVRSGEEE